MSITEQIRKLKTRLKSKPDPLLAETLKSLQELERLETVEGLIDFHQKEFCSIDDAASYLGCAKETVLKNVKNSFKPDGRPQRIDIPAVEFYNGKKKSYIVLRRALKSLKDRYI